MIRTQGLTHIHLVVRDLERAVTFYQRAFGLEERFREGSHMVFLGTPEGQDLITLNQAPQQAELAGVNGGVEHFGFRFSKSDFDAAITQIEDAGGKLIHRGEHAPGVPFAYVRDPEGYVIELLP
jgi:catechol 2,3-dioxygenase-like lactoylglutathione lyase family enzyme